MSDGSERTSRSGRARRGRRGRDETEAASTPAFSVGGPPRAAGSVVVVGLRLAAFDGRGLPERAREAETAAVANGGVLVAFGWNFVAFSFPADQEDAMGAFIARVDAQARTEEGAWAIGIARGDLDLVADDGAHGELSWGSALVLAGRLAEGARPGEALVAGDLVHALLRRTGRVDAGLVRASDGAWTGRRLLLASVDSPPPGSEHPSVSCTQPDSATLATAHEARLHGEDEAPTERPSTLLRRERRVPSDDAGGHGTAVGQASELLAQLLGTETSGDGEASSANAPGRRATTTDHATLERWAMGHGAGRERSAFSDRMRVLSRLGRGDIDDALRVLRRARAELDPKDHGQRCQASLAMGVALSVAGRPDEALLEGMDALARARHAGDERGAEACLAFLSKLFVSVGKASLLRHGR